MEEEKEKNELTEQDLKETVETPVVEDEAYDEFDEQWDGPLSPNSKAILVFAKPGMRLLLWLVFIVVAFIFVFIMIAILDSILGDENIAGKTLMYGCIAILFLLVKVYKIVKLAFVGIAFPMLYPELKDK